MKLELFNYNLSKESIAKKPASPRDSAKLFVYNRLNKKSIHSQFNKIGSFLQKGDVLVLNDTRVIPARLIARMIHTNGTRGRKFKILLLEKKATDVWTALIDGRGREAGVKLFFSKDLQGVIIKKLNDGIWEVRFNKKGKTLEDFIFRLGQMPLPPYIKQEKYLQKNKDWYQTVYAKDAGSVAAPTAGLHFTRRLLKELKKKGVSIEYITLHVGMGTFMPVKTNNIKEHKMHDELATVTKLTANRLNKAKREGRRIIAVGTTSARTLEAFAMPYGKQYSMKYGNKNVNIFIYPPYRFKFIDAIITNFHLPKSTLLMMMSAFISEGDIKGIKTAKKLYQEAIKKKYTFYSYGDAMLIE
ncbi:MAG: tRNA preQ1(34) S-adenosylmethionine ribosyltransferase-isomerase QueA [Parcubacteria group bacterium CG10_big_fil_rev_8_21_14_0_10_36_14]|nr:MAG: tRNA preQ1(34) S-adenosylmethionine ribosyltransferase-isomerase QueA [Parcubacteria group bacterium CG10_big_fil_rev_8_21_14_0_10_36_14]